jgi:hypothetical protein
MKPFSYNKLKIYLYVSKYKKRQRLTFLKRIKLRLLMFTLYFVVLLKDGLMQKP